MRLLDDAGSVMGTADDFMSPSVDTATQSVLVKAAIVERRGQFRTDQFVRVRVVWSTEPGLTCRSWR